MSKRIVIPCDAPSNKSGRHGWQWLHRNVSGFDRWSRLCVRCGRWYDDVV